MAEYAKIGEGVEGYAYVDPETNELVTLQDDRPGSAQTNLRPATLEEIEGARQGLAASSLSQKAIALGEQAVSGATFGSAKTLPFMTPTIFYNLVTGVIATFQVFNQAYIMTQGGPNNATLFYIYYLYRVAFTESNIAYASTLAWVLFVIVLAVTVLLFRNARHWVYYEMGGAR